MRTGALLQEAFFALCYELALFIEGRLGFLPTTSPRALARHQALLQACKWVREHCAGYWIDWMTRKTMASVDRQAAVIRREWDKAPQPIFTEVTEGETPLGGEMRLRAPFAEEDTDQAS